MKIELGKTSRSARHGVRGNPTWIVIGSTCDNPGQIIFGFFMSDPFFEPDFSLHLGSDLTFVELSI